MLVRSFFILIDPVYWIKLPKNIKPTLHKFKAILRAIAILYILTDC